MQIVTDIHEMLGFDNVALARVLGWNVIVKKSECSVGDKVVYFEIDSILPSDNPEFDFLKNSKGKMKPLKPKKIRGYVSQGLVMPLSILPEGEYEEGQDVTELLGVVKYDPEVKLQTSFGGHQFPTYPFPVFVPKTDEERVQTIPRLLENRYTGHKFVLTEKLDGTSITCFVRDGQFGVCSRNFRVPYDGSNLHGSVALQFDLENKFLELRKHLGYDFALQGELIGNGIQKNPYRINGYDIRWYNLFNIDKQKDVGFYFSDSAEYEAFNGYTLGQVAALLDMETVPILNSDFTMINDIDALVDMASGKSLLNPEREREGIVFRAKKNNELSDFGERVSFKAISLDFLLPS